MNDLFQIRRVSDFLTPKASAHRAWLFFFLFFSLIFPMLLNWDITSFLMYVDFYLFSPISSYERVNTKKIHSKFKDNLFLRVLLVSGRSRRSGATSHDVRKSNFSKQRNLFQQLFWSNFQKCKKSPQVLTQSHILATTLVSPATVRNLEVWKCHLGQSSKDIDDVNKREQIWYQWEKMDVVPRTRETFQVFSIQTFLRPPSPRGLPAPPPRQQREKDWDM